MNRKKNMELLFILLVLMIASCGKVNNKSDEAGAEENSIVEAVGEKESFVSEEIADFHDEAEDRYQDNLTKLNGRKDVSVVYSDGQYIWYVRKKDNGGYHLLMSVYDSRTDATAKINMNKFGDASPEDYLYVSAFAENEGKVTVILCDDGRCGSGWIDATSVWTIDTKTRKWKPVMKNIAGAKFVKNGTAVKIEEATILNPDAEASCYYEYSSSYRTISLL